MGGRKGRKGAEGGIEARKQGRRKWKEVNGEGRHDGQEERVLTTTNMKVKGFIQRGGRGEALGFSPLLPKK